MKPFFISHSSIQKPFVEKLVEQLGKDKCIVDKYDFEAANKTYDEIIRCLNSCTFFVLLISVDSLKSKWVQEESYIAYNKMRSGKIRRILPYIIDDKVSLDDVPSWIKDDECYNLKYFNSPKLLVRDLNQKNRAFIWEKDERVRIKNTMFVGWNDKIDEFQQKVYSGDGSSKKAMILSGRNGIGKERFFYNCIGEIGTYTKNLEPFVIKVDSKSSIETVIIQLNSIIEEFRTEESLSSVLSSTIDSKTDVAVALINKLYAAGSVLWIYDQMGCVRPERILSDWFEKILTHPNLDKTFGLFLFSIVTPNTYIESKYKELIHIHLMPMTKSDRKKLFFKVAKAIGIDTITDRDADYFVTKLLESPEQLIEAVFSIKNNGLGPSKGDVDLLVQLGDSKGTAIIDYIKKDDIRFKISVVLSRVEFLNVSYLSKILDFEEEDILSSIKDLMSWSLIEMFGPNDMYVQLDSFVSDYFNRNKLNRDKEIERLLDEVLSDAIRESTDITEDVSAYIFDKRKKLLRDDDSSVYLIPHIVIKAIIDTYNKREWNEVVKMCDRMLLNNHNVFPEIIRETNYWLCQTLARTNNDRFFKVVTTFDGLDKDFLMGFYYRNAHNYPQAYYYYNKVLERNPKVQRARREMVVVLLSMRRYDDALDFAKENYEQDSSNSYHINAYFRCLVKKLRPDKDDKKMMRYLLAEMEKNYSPKRDSILLSMQIEYEAYVEKTATTIILNMISEAQRKFPESLDIKRVANDYFFSRSIISNFDDIPEDVD